MQDLEVYIFNPLKVMAWAPANHFLGDIKVFSTQSAVKNLW